MDFNMKQFAKPNKLAGEFDPDAKHANMLHALTPFAKPSTSQKDLNLEESLDYVTKKTKALLILMPEWSPHFPPFNLARLSAVAKNAGYQTRILDVNVLTYNAYKNIWNNHGQLGYDLWTSTSAWRVTDKDYYQKHIHPMYEPLFLELLKQIENYKPDFVGFSQYYVNEQATDWMADQIKKRMPNVITAVGGSNIQNGWQQPKAFYDYFVNGEGEQIIVDILDQVESGYKPTAPVHIKQPEEQRLVLNDLPLPDYASIDFNLYEIPNGVNSELSRGCIAKCTFCEETHFFKYRQRTHQDSLKEIEYLYHQKGTDVIWFIDSLVNGSLKELRSFCKGVVERGLKIKWTGYCRCDGRMDLDFYKDLAASGCVMLNYGIESGSQRVLNDMNKGVTIDEMEQNFRDGKATGIWAATNWIVGFPTEQYEDFADTMTFLWRNRNMNINNIGAGAGYGLGLETIVGQNFNNFNLLDHKYMGHWIRKDFSFGGTHMMIRVKSFNIFLDHLIAENKFSYPHRQNLKKLHYTLDFVDSSIQKEISFEKFDYNIIKPNINPFADSLANEIWPVLRMLWKTRGPYSTKILFNPDLDLNEFGQQYGGDCFNAEYLFSINECGEWTAHFKMQFAQKEYPNDPRKPASPKPFMAQDFSRIKSASATRARKFAKPTWGEAGRSDDEFNLLMQEEDILNKTIDFSFDLDWSGTGKWD